MRRILVLAVAAATCGVTIAACSGGGKKGVSGNGELHTGDYVISNSAVQSDGCAAGLDPTQIDGGQFTITVSAGMLSFPVTLQGDLATGPYAAGVFDSKYSADIDLSQFSTPYDCILTVDYEYAGASTTVDAADAAETIGYKAKSGAGCAMFASDNMLTLPCKSQDTQHITIVPPPEIVTATLTMGTGYGTTLTNDYYLENTNSTLTVSVLASGLTFNLANNFQCYTPTATTLNYYELGTYTPSIFALRIDSAGWGVGSKTLDGTLNTLDLDLTDAAGNEFIGSATGGSVTLSAAPMTTGGMCSFGATSVPMMGQLIHPAFAPDSTQVTHKRRLDLTAKSWKLEQAAKPKSHH